MADQPTPAGGAGEQAAEAVLAAGDGAPVPAAVSRPEPLDVLEGRGVDEGTKGRRLARPEATDVEGVGQDLGHVLEGKAGRGPYLAVGPAARGKLVDPADERYGGLVDPERPSFADRAQRGLVPAGDAEPAPLGRVPLPDPLAEPAAVGLGLDRLARPPLPLVLVRREHTLVGEQDHRASGVEVVAGVDRGPQVACESGDVADDEHVPLVPCAREHLGPLAGGRDRPSGVGHLPGPARVDEAPTLDGSGLLLELRIGSEVVRLTRCGLADPTGRTAAAEILEGAG